jgi:serine/threonine protein kinase
MIGQTIGKYRILSRLGRGGMGTVYKGVDATLDREVAIKVLNPDLADSDILKRFRAEAMTLARLNHPNIATIYELCQHDDELLMVMEFLRGETFDALSSRVGPMPIERAAYLCSQVLDALGHAHRAGIVHRDLKPANLMLTEGGIVKVMDFGIARVIGTEHLTNDGYMMGTPAYMAPEQVMGGEIDGRADLYAMGVVLYRLLTGTLPFKAETPMAMVQKQLKDPPTPLRQFREELPGWCEELLDRALAKPVEQRFQTADDFRGALVRAMSPTASVEQTSTALMPVVTDLGVTLPPNSLRTPFAMPAPVVSPATASIPAASEPATQATAAERTVVLRTSHVAVFAAAIVLLVVALAGVTVAVVRRGPASAAPPASSLPQPPASVAATSPPSPLPSPPVPASSGAVPPAPKTASIPAGRAPTAAAHPDASKASNPAPSTGATAPGPSDTAPPDPPPAPVAAVAPIVFSSVRLLVLDGGKGHERSTALRLTPTTLEWMDGQQPMKVLRYDSLIGVYTSHAREPRWITPGGVAIPLSKDDGKLAFLKPDKDWITVRTKSEFVPFRPDSSAFDRILALLQQRTGLKALRAKD